MSFHKLSGGDFIIVDEDISVRLRGRVVEVVYDADDNEKHEFDNRETALSYIETRLAVKIAQNDILPLNVEI